MKQRLLIFYDFEVFRNDYLAVFICPQERWEKVIVNDRDEFINFYNEHKTDLFVGFNSKSYDMWIYRAIIFGIKPYNMSKFLISDKNIHNPSKYGNNGSDYDRRLSQIQFYNYDCFLGSTMVDKSLKSHESSLGLDIRETEVDFDLDRKLTQEEIDKTVFYCRHDVISTIYVFLERVDIFKAYVTLITNYGLTMDDFNKTRAQLSAAVLDARRLYPMPDDEWRFIIPKCLKLGKYEFVKEWFLNPDNHNYNKSQLVHTKWCDVTIAYGGAHDTRQKLDYRNCKLLNVDVSSYYPNLMREYGLLSRGITKPELYFDMLRDRITWKKTNPSLASASKVILNSTYGMSKDVHSPCLDKRMANSVCISGQLLLLDLIEKIESHCEILNVNTDGLLVKCETDEDIEKVKELANEWEKRSGMPLEYDSYVTFISRDVNTYLLVDENGHAKSKGAVKEISALENNMAVVNKAMKAYFLEGITPEEFIAKDDVLMDYMNTCKLKGDFTKIYHLKNGTLIPQNGKVARVFASTRDEDGYVGRIRETNKKQSTFDEFDLDCIGGFGEYKSVGGAITGMNKFANTSEHCFIDNSDIRGKKCPDYLDKQFYIDLTWSQIRMWQENNNDKKDSDLLDI